MRTIEEKAEEYAENAYIVFPKSAVKSAFIAGYNAANEWISVEDELPPEHESVLVKLDGNTILLGIIDDNKKWEVYYSYGRSGQYNERPITHWRPINND